MRCFLWCLLWCFLLWVFLCGPSSGQPVNGHSSIPSGRSPKVKISSPCSPTSAKALSKWSMILCPPSVSNIAPKVLPRSSAYEVLTAASLASIQVQRASPSQASVMAFSMASDLSMKTPRSSLSIWNPSSSGVTCARKSSTS